MLQSQKYRSFMKSLAFSGVSALALTAMAAPAYAQDADADQANDDSNVIIVTATKRDSSIKDVPFSINAQTQEDIQRSGSTNLEDISRNVAGLSIQNLGPGQSQVSVRGVSAGQIVRDQPGVKEQVGVYLDESVISLSLFTPDLDLFDLNRVETLRGPQGTLFGSGSVGGTVRYITNQPQLGIVEGSVEGNVNLVDGDDFGGSLKGMVNLPLGTGGAVRLVGYYTRYGGFINALGENGSVREDVNDGERYGGRIAVAFEPGPGVTITPRLIYQKIETNGFNRQEVFNLYANPFTTTRPTVNFDEREQYLLLEEGFEDETTIGDLTVNAAWDGVALTSVTSYTYRDILVSRDASALTGSVSVDLGYPDAAVLLPSNLRDTTKVKSFTQEIRLASDYDSPFQWVIGGFYANTKRTYAQRLPTPGYDVFTDAILGDGTAAATNGSYGPDSPYNADLPYDLAQLAFFGEGTYDLTDAFHVTVGARYYDYAEQRRFTSGGLFSNSDDQRDKTKSSGVTPRVLLAYDVSDEITLNAQASKGFRLGGVNDPLNLDLCEGGATGPDARIFGGFQDYDDETLWNYEAGVKVQTGNFSLNAAGFYTDIKNLQVTLDAGTCSSRVVFNAPKAHTVGLEFETTVSPTDGLAFGISGSYVEAEFDSTVRDSTGAVLGGVREGNRLPSVPKFQISGNASYSFPIGEGAEAYFSGSVQHVGSRFTQPSDQENNPRSFVSGLAFGGAPGTDATVVNLKLPSYEVVNLSAGIDFDSGLSVIAYVNNLLDENALLSFDRERGGRARLAFTTNQPRTFGLTVRQDF